MFSTFTALPVLSMEILGEILLLGFALIVVIRVHRRAGLALAFGASVVLVSQLSSAGIDVAAIALVSSGNKMNPPEEMIWAIVAMIFAAWAPYLGRVMQLVSIVWAIRRLIERIPPSVYDVPPPAP